MIQLDVKFKMDNTDLEKTLALLVQIEDKINKLGSAKSELTNILLGDFKQQTTEELKKLGENQEKIEKEILSINAAKQESKPDTKEKEKPEDQQE